MSRAVRDWSRVEKICPGGTSSALALMVALAGGFAARMSAQEQAYTERVLYSFAGGSDGAEPLAGGVRGGAGTPPRPHRGGGPPRRGKLETTAHARKRNGRERVST